MTGDYKDFPISTSESLSDIEDKAFKLGLDIPYKIRLPSRLKAKGALGIEAAVLQLLGTWLHKNKYKKVFHSYQQNKPEDFKELCSSIYGIAALSMVDEVWDKEKNIIQRGLTLQEAKETIESLRKGRFSNCFKSKYFGIPYIKTERYDKEFDMPFYNGSKVIDADAFYRIIEKILLDNIEGFSRFKRLKEMIDIEELSDLLWELLKNSHDHGRSDKFKNILTTNFRTLIIQQQDLTEAYFDTWCGEFPSKAQSAFRDNWLGIKRGKYSFLDLSVVDFGAGFVDLAKEKLDIGSDMDIFMKCMEQGWSRFPERNRGDGLTKILNTVHKYKGWLRIRTGNLLLEKTFIEGVSNKVVREDIKVMSSSVVVTSVHVSLPLSDFKGRGN